MLVLSMTVVLACLQLLTCYLLLFLPAEAILREVAILKACHSTYIVGFRGVIASAPLLCP